MTIPKIIHQTVADKANVHSLFQQNIHKIRSLNPDYEYHLYDDADISELIRKHYGNAMLDCFERINPAYGAARADLFRYLLMYKIGGVYLDIKSTMHRPLDDVLRPDDSYLLSHWRNGPGEPFYGWGMHWGCGPRGEYQQWHIVAAPEHPFLAAVIKKVVKNIEDYDPSGEDHGKAGVWRTTGPIPYTIAIREIVEKFAHRLVDIEDLGFYYSIAEDVQFGHVPLVGPHYSNSVEPIVIGGAADTSKSSSFHKSIFNRIYHENLWGQGSGPGSSFDNTIEYREFLQKFLTTNKIKTVVDIGCGDWQFSRYIDWNGIHYTGLDVSDVVLANTRAFAADGIEFHEFDALSGELPRADLAIMKDVIQHWSNADILAFLPKLKNFDHVLITNGFPDYAMRRLNADIRPGEYRSIDLSLPPFNLKGSFVFWYTADEPKFVYYVGLSVRDMPDARATEAFVDNRHIGETWREASFGVLTSERVAGTNWALGRYGEPPYCPSVRLLKDGRIGGYIHPNEKTWSLQKDRLIISNVRGEPTTVFDQCRINQNGDILLTGPFVLNPSFGIVHCLKETPKSQCISKDPSKFKIDWHFNGQKRRNLVILGANETSLHHQWTRNIDNDDRNWDLALSFYGDPMNYPPPGPVEYTSLQPGLRKWDAMHRAMYEGSPFWEYERIFVVDDDIMTSWLDVNHFFEICRDLDLLLAQPSLRPGCFVTHDITAQQSGSLIRFTTFVEAMIPCFTRQALRQCIATAQGSQYGFGVDHIWPKILGMPKNRIGIVDAVAFEHTRPFATKYSQHLAESEERDLFQRYGVGWPYDIRETGSLKL